MIRTASDVQNAYQNRCRRHGWDSGDAREQVVEVRVDYRSVNRTPYERQDEVDRLEQLRSAIQSQKFKSADRRGTYMRLD